MKSTDGCEFHFLSFGGLYFGAPAKPEGFRSLSRSSISASSHTQLFGGSIPVGNFSNFWLGSRQTFRGRGARNSPV